MVLEALGIINKFTIGSQEDEIQDGESLRRYTSGVDSQRESWIISLLRNIILVAFVLFFWYVFISMILLSIKCIRKNKKWTTIQSIMDFIGSFTHPFIKYIGVYLSGDKCWMGNLPGFVLYLIAMDIFYFNTLKNTYEGVLWSKDNTLLDMPSMQPENRDLIINDRITFRHSNDDRLNKSTPGLYSRNISPFTVGSGRRLEEARMRFDRKGNGNMNRNGNMNGMVRNSAMKRNGNGNGIIPSSGKYLVFVLASWCEYCKQLKTDLGHINLFGRGQFSKLNIDHDHVIIIEDPDEPLAKQLGVEGYPAIMLYNNGKKITDHKGDRTPEALKNTFNSGR